MGAALPVLTALTALARSERYAQEQGKRHKSVPIWAHQLIRQLHRWYPERRLVVVGDSAYATLDLLAAVRPLATVVTRLRLDAQLFAPVPPRRPRHKGWPRLVDSHLPTLEARHTDATTLWTHLTVAHWYGGAREVEGVSDTAVWYHTGLPPVPIRWALIRDPQGHLPTQALLCADLEVPADQILAWFVRRWQVEVTFHAIRGALGDGNPAAGVSAPVRSNNSSPLQPVFARDAAGSL